MTHKTLNSTTAKGTRKLVLANNSEQWITLFSVKGKMKIFLNFLLTTKVSELVINNIEVSRICVIDDRPRALYKRKGT